MTAALEGGEWSAARPGRTLLSGKTRLPILQEAGWDPGPVWMGGTSRPHRDTIPDRPARSQLLYRLSFPAHKLGINRIDLPVLFRGSPTRLNINQYFRPTNPLMIIVSSWAGNAPVVNCYLWELNGGVRRCSVIWKQFESVVGGTTHCTRRSVLSNPELVLRVHVLSGH